MSSTKFHNKRLQDVRSLLAKSADADHAEFHKEYHKSSKKFYGLRAKQMTDITNIVFPKRVKLPKEESIQLASELWSSDWFEEQVVGLLLLERIAKDLAPGDLPYIKKMVGQCEGWGPLDWIATKMLGELAIGHGDHIYPKVRTWTKSKHLWTRRAAISSTFFRHGKRN